MQIYDLFKRNPNKIATKFQPTDSQSPLSPHFNPPQPLLPPLSAPSPRSLITPAQPTNLHIFFTIGKIAHESL